ncbi:hypothetical protein DB30_00303 [Enhygromyxa salina]|uniref:Uncharacterized protein n=1 Tax=Enhygromyxa salina TaxID=215803 RepID=A0A0C2A5A3_9BACT|nr:hypothetical protein [Enhygromyxa salina]KIG18618.1 hypothetical protein DB30_00303 [Enhygromyxa salina]
MEARKVVVTLVCAADDEDALEAIADGLRAVGREVRLVPGVDVQPRRLGEAIERGGDLGLIVVCTSGRLEGAQLRTVEGLFSARRGPNHAMVRVELSATANENIAAISRATEAFVANQGRVVRRTTGEGPKLREVIPVESISSVALPVVRLPPGEELDGDTQRIQLPDNPKSAELSRRRRAARERERERERITRSHRTLNANDDINTVGDEPVSAQMQRDEDRLDRLMIGMIIGAGVLAVLAALTFAGIF